MAAADYKASVAEAEKVVAKQRNTEAKVSSCIDELIKNVTESRDKALAGQAGPALAQTLGQLRTTSDAAFKEANNATKELHGAIAKLGKALDTCIKDDVDLEKVRRDVQWKPETVHKILAEHFFREGRFQVGNKLCEEAGLQECRGLAEPYRDLHTILKQIRGRELEGALDWVKAALAAESAAANQQATSAAVAQPPGTQTAGSSAPSGGSSLFQILGRAADALRRHEAPQMVPQPTATTSAATPRSPSAIALSKTTTIAALQAFQFRLHSLQFLKILVWKGKGAALQYSRQHLAPLACTHMSEIQRLMGCMVFYLRAKVNGPCKRWHATAPPPPTSSKQDDTAMETDTPTPTATSDTAPTPTPSQPAQTAQQDADAMAVDGEAVDVDAGESDPVLGDAVTLLRGSPYESFVGRGAWEEVEREFMRLACSLLRRASESPLSTVVSAGASVLPELHKLMSVMTSGGVVADLKGTDQLPIELPLGQEFVFHPIFACPVSKDQSTPDNPPLLLPCNHVLCEQSVLRIAKNRTRIFKCPYCPVEARVDNLRPLVFPLVE